VKEAVQPPVAAGPRAGMEHLERAIKHLRSLQHPDGYWEAEMVWNTMLLSQYVLARATVGGKHWPIAAEERRLILKNYQVTQLADGSWPMHGEGEGYVFFTGLAYVALRVLGLSPDEPMTKRAREWLRAHGGVLAIPSWGKLWLSMMGLYEYEGVNSIPPELFVVPDWVPVHPNNFYCHTRYIYLAISYLYGRRFRRELSIARELREELYEQPYDTIDFAAHRHDLAATDVFVRPSAPLRAAWDALALYEKRPLASLRRRALNHCFERIQYEMFASLNQGISPVNGLLNCLALFDRDPNDPEIDAALAAMESWKWQDEEEGIRYCGAHSTAWDTAFVMRAILASPTAAGSLPELQRAYAWLKQTQMQEELPSHESQRREPILGGWCFSDGEHRWAVSDCTAEALTAILQLHEAGLAPMGAGRIADERIVEAVRFILRRQNADGGFGSYERRRGSVLLEWINPSEMYGNCMTERSYTECTASCVGALARFRTAFPTVWQEEIDDAIARGVALLRSRQLADGSYLGFWGVNFTYGCFHVIEALRAVGVPARDPAIARAAEWLLTKQKADGGWGEHWKSALTDEYTEHPESQAAMTAWALLALLEALPADDKAIRRGIECLRKLQLTDGSWPRQSQSGVFFATALLDYRLYKDDFSTWALARYASATGA
jgi:lanosterol synthase